MFKKKLQILYISIILFKIVNWLGVPTIYHDKSQFKALLCCKMMHFFSHFDIYSKNQEKKSTQITELYCMEKSDETIK